MHSSLHSPSRLWRSLLFRSGLVRCEIAAGPSEPLHCDPPALRNAEIAAVYLGQRVAGDFYEFLRVGPSRMLFVLLDIAGLRADTREILTALQRTFRTGGPRLFAAEDINENTAMIELCYEMNRTIMSAGLRSCPAFIGCVNADLGTLCYANAGHTPALLRDDAGISLLRATGLPLGLFSHTTQSAATCHLVAGAALLGVSRGIVEAASATDESLDFGMEGVKDAFQRSRRHPPDELCLAMLRAVEEFAPMISQRADITTLALVRHRVRL